MTFANEGPMVRKRALDRVCVRTHSPAGLLAASPPLPARNVRTDRPSDATSESVAIAATTPTCFALAAACTAGASIEMRASATAAAAAHRHSKRLSQIGLA